MATRGPRRSGAPARTRARARTREKRAIVPATASGGIASIGPRGAVLGGRGHRRLGVLSLRRVHARLVPHPLGGLGLALSTFSTPGSSLIRSADSASPLDSSTPGAALILSPFSAAPPAPPRRARPPRLAVLGLALRLRHARLVPQPLGAARSPRRGSLGLEPAQKERRERRPAAGRPDSSWSRSIARTHYPRRPHLQVSSSSRRSDSRSSGAVRTQPYVLAGRRGLHAAEGLLDPTTSWGQALVAMPCFARAAFPQASRGALGGRARPRSRLQPRAATTRSAAAGGRESLWLFPAYRRAPAKIITGILLRQADSSRASSTRSSARATRTRSSSTARRPRTRSPRCSRRSRRG